MTTSPYRLVRSPPAPASRLVPDAAQQAVLDHREGPLLVLAGPGTGKTTTLVEAVARRVEGGLTPEQVLVLTFSRKAAAELRDRITSRLGTPTAGPSAWTFHAFCYALLREQQPAGLYTDPLRLLSGPEQDVALRDLLKGSLELGRTWPPTLRAALTTRGLAEEVRALLSRAREVGMDPDQLGALAAREGREDWSALARFFGEYLDVLDAQGALDYAELVHRAVLLAETPEVAAVLRRRYRAVFVDEYQDTDPAQERLLRALAGDGGDLVVVGDPDQAIYAFRGAEVSGLLEFPRRFRRVDGADAPVLALQTCRRSGERLLAVSRHAAEKIPLPPSLRELRTVTSAKGQCGLVEVHTFGSVGAEAEAIADLLRREHLESGTRWSDMAVLVRSGARSVPLLRRVFAAAGVPMDVAGDEVPLAQEPAVAPLLMGLRVAADRSALTNEAARQLLLSPLGGADPGALRRLGRALRALDRLARDRAGLSPLPAPSADLIRQAVEDPRNLLLLDESVARPARRLAELIAKARAALTAGPEAALWELWSGSPWPLRLERASLQGGGAGRAADRDLDAVVALFSMISRAQDRRRGRVTALLDEIEAQQIPGDTLSEQGVRGEAVRLLTAHRSKGLEWEVVVVAGVQEGVWPDLRSRSTLLQSDRLDRDGLREPQDRADLLADERRLFYVALTRAKRRVVVTAVDSPEDDGDRPSRLLADTGVPRCVNPDRVARPLSLTALVATLRRQSIDPLVSDGIRAAAASRLARLAHATDDAGLPLAPQADPARWWGLLDTTRSEFPIAPLDLPLPLSGSSLQRLEECPLRWFLEKQAAAESASSTAMGFGNVVHALAHEIGQGQTAPVVEDLMRRLDTVWHQLAFDAPWQSEQQREQARLALERLVGWHAEDRGRTLVGTEKPFRVELTVDGRDVVLNGSMDRVETDADGRVHVVDLKTTKSHPSKDEIAGHAQLGTYQFAVRESGDPVGGAELVQLRTETGAAKVQAQGAIDPAPGWVDELLSRAVARIVEETFPPDVDPKRCGRCAFARCCPAQPEGRQVVE